MKIAIRKCEILSFKKTWMDLGNIMLSEIRERHIYDFTHIWNLRNKTNEERKRERPKNTLFFFKQALNY